MVAGWSIYAGSGTCEGCDEEFPEEELTFEPASAMYVCPLCLEGPSRYVPDDTGEGFFRVCGRSTEEGS